MSIYLIYNVISKYCCVVVLGFMYETESNVSLDIGTCRT